MAKQKESKQKKIDLRVDFTPMVDMMMLLITFFMLCKYCPHGRPAVLRWDAGALERLFKRKQ